MAEAQFPPSKLRKLAALPDRLNGLPPTLLAGPPRKVLMSLMNVAELSAGADWAALAASVAVYVPELSPRVLTNCCWMA